MTDSSAVQRLLKVTAAGRMFRDDLYEDGTLTEWLCGAPDETWPGRWSSQARRTRLEVAGYALLSRSGTPVAVETDPWGEETRAFLLTISDSDPTPGVNRPYALVKSGRGDRAYFATLFPDGHVEEFDLIEGIDERPWEGDWWRDGDDVVIRIGEHVWHSRRTGLEWAGDEATPGGSQPLVGYLIENSASELRDGLRSRQRLFSYNGYQFFATARELGGHFSHVLEARRYSGDRQLSFAAKIVKTGMTVVQTRELDYLDQFSATDGLIAAIDSFDIPATGDFSNYHNGHVIILEWGDTDAKRTVTDEGALAPAHVAALIADISRALSAMHTKFQAVHADVKLDNIIGRRTGATISWRLTDFNVTSDINPVTGHAPFLGTTAVCISPELQALLDARQPRLEPSDDIWALGVVAVQALSGQVLPPGRRAHRDGLLTLISDSPQELVELIGATLAPARDRVTAMQLQVRALALVTTLGDTPARAKDSASGAPPEASDTMSSTLRESSAVSLLHHTPERVPQSEREDTNTVGETSSPMAVHVDITGYPDGPGDTQLTKSRLIELLRELEYVGWFLIFSTDDPQTFIQTYRTESGYIVEYQLGNRHSHYGAESDDLDIVGDTIWYFLINDRHWAAALTWFHQSP